MDQPVAGPDGISGHCSNLVVLEDEKQTAELWDVFVFSLPLPSVLVSFCQLNTSWSHLGRENLG